MTVVDRNEEREKNGAGVKSTAAIGKHPIHPMLIPFPIAFLVGALATDAIYWLTRAEMWAWFSFWLIYAGLVMGIIAAIVGFIDFASIDAVRRLTAAWIHFAGNGLVLLLALANLLIRWDNQIGAVLPAGIVISAVVSAILVVTGWYGGELSFRHRIGVSGDERDDRAGRP